jgi:sulfite exporter TauE/SafE
MDMLAAWCGPLGAGGAAGWRTGALLSGGLYAGLLLAGAAGSVVHCVPMCGPFVLGQVSDRLARMPGAMLCERQRFGSALLLPYHAGRLITYAALGALAGEAGATLGRLAWFGWLSGALLAVAALLFLAHALRRLAPSLAPYLGRIVPGSDRAPGGWVRLIRLASSRVDRTRPIGGLLLGLTLGFLPCGFLYAALAAAAATAGPLTGAAAMVCFGFGTVPSLVAVGLAGHAAGRTFHRGVTAFAPAVLLVNAAVLGVLAWERLSTLV